MAKWVNKFSSLIANLSLSELEGKNRVKGITYLQGKIRTKSAGLNDSMHTAQHSRKSRGTAKLFEAVGPEAVVEVVVTEPPGKSLDLSVLVGIFSRAFLAATQSRR